jgi:type IV pilus assembly protein PilM
MGFGLPLRNKNKVNLLIKDHVIQFLDSKQPGIGSVIDFGERYIPGGIIEEGKIINSSALQEILQDCVKKWGIKRREVQFLVPDPVVVVRKVEVPKDIPDNEIRGYLYLELGTSIHLPYDNPLFHVEVLGHKDGKKEILVFAAPEHIVNEYASIIEQVGLKPTVADISPLAVYRLYYLHEAKQSKPILSVQFDIQNVTVSIFNKHKLIFVRQLKMNLKMELWKEELDKDGVYLKWTGEEDYLEHEIQEMIDEIDRVLNFYQYTLSQENDQIESILLTGDHPLLIEIDRKIQDVVGIPTVTFLSKKFRTVNNITIPSRYHLIQGLSLKGVQ